MPASVILTDADLPALVAASLAQEEGGGLAALEVPGHPAAGAAIRAHLELLGAELIGALPPADLSTTLLAGARIAAAAGAAQLIWPVAVNADLDRMCREADRALLISRLITLEPELSPAAGAGRFEVQAPLLDLSDAQVAELAIDLDVPVWRCWWWPVVGGAGAPRPPADSPLEGEALTAARALAKRWTAALRAVGWAEDIELASITSA